MFICPFLEKLNPRVHMPFQICTLNTFSSLLLSSIIKLAIRDLEFDDFFKTTLIYRWCSLQNCTQSPSQHFSNELILLVSHNANGSIPYFNNLFYENQGNESTISSLIKSKFFINLQPDMNSRSESFNCTSCKIETKMSLFSIQIHADTHTYI